VQLPNPNDGKPFDRIVKDAQGNDLYGYRKEHSPDEEIVYIPTQRSNQTYHQPEPYISPEHCPHDWHFTSVGKREVECKNCGLPTSFVVGVNYKEEQGDPWFCFKKTWYKIAS